MDTFQPITGQTAENDIAKGYAKYGAQSYLEASRNSLENFILPDTGPDPKHVEPLYLRNVSRTMLGPGKEIAVQVKWNDWKMIRPNDKIKTD